MKHLDIGHEKARQDETALQLCLQRTKVWREVTRPPQVSHVKARGVGKQTYSDGAALCVGLKMIRRGDRVKVTTRAAAAFNNNKRPGKVDWTARRGVVERITNNKASAIVLWDGRKSVETVPISSIEPEPAELG